MSLYGIPQPKEVNELPVFPWWRHQMETFSALLALCEWRRAVSRSFDVFFDLRLNRRLIKQRASCQICKIASCACAGNAGNVFPATHVPWCMPGSLPSGFLWSRRRGKRSLHSRRMRNPQSYVYGKRPMDTLVIWDTIALIVTSV